MKKIITLALTVILVLSLCAPVFADGVQSVLAGYGGEYDGEEGSAIGDNNNYLTIEEDTTLESAAEIVVAGIDIASGATLTIAEGTTVRFVKKKGSDNYGVEYADFNISEGAALVVNGSLVGSSNTHVRFTCEGDITLNAGGMISFVYTGSLPTKVLLYLTTLDVFTNESFGDGPCIYAHNHKFGENDFCYVCGHSKSGTTSPYQSYPDPGLFPISYPASTLSEGSVTVIVGVACAVVFLALGIVIGMAISKKKKK